MNSSNATNTSKISILMCPPTDPESVVVGRVKSGGLCPPQCRQSVAPALSTPVLLGTAHPTGK